MKKRVTKAALLKALEAICYGPKNEMFDAIHKARVLVDAVRREVK